MNQTPPSRPSAPVPPTAPQNLAPGKLPPTRGRTAEAPASAPLPPQKHHKVAANCLMVFFLFFINTSILFSQAYTDNLYHNFQNPPPDARPMMRWWGFGPGVVKTELEKELRTMKDAGIGGVEIQPVYPLMLDDSSKGINNLPYLSPDFLDAVTFANRTARSLGLRVDITLGSGWPYGGPPPPPHPPARPP